MGYATKPNWKEKHQGFESQGDYWINPDICCGLLKSHPGLSVFGGGDFMDLIIPAPRGFRINLPFLCRFNLTIPD